MFKKNNEFFRKLSWKSLKADFFDLFKGLTFLDILIFSVLPIFVTLLMFLPAAIRESLALNIQNSSWWQFFTSAFMHRDWGHLWGNVSAYIFIGFILLLFANKTKNKKDLFWMFIILLICLPLISSAIQIFYPDPSLRISQGSSGIVSASLGFLPIMWVYYFSRKQNKNLISASFFYICLSYAVFLFVLRYYPIHKNIMLVFPMMFLILMFGCFYRNNFKILLRTIFDESEENVLFYFLVIIAPLLFLALPFKLFPLDFIQEGNRIDFFMHCVGFLFGIALSFVFLKIKFSDYQSKLS